MIIKCDHVVKARRPNIVVVDKERNKAIIIGDVDSPWDPRVQEKEGEKIDNKLLVPRFEDGDWKTMGYPAAERVVVAHPSKKAGFKAWIKRLDLKAGDDHQDGMAAENSFVRKSKDLMEGVGKVKKE